MSNSSQPTGSGPATLVSFEDLSYVPLVTFELEIVTMEADDLGA